MRVSVLRGNVASAIDELRSLLSNGEARASGLQLLAGRRNLGLWSDVGPAAVASAQLLALSDRLPSAFETLPAVLSVLPEVRSAWLRIARARLREMGDRNDVVSLTEAVTFAGALAAELVAAPEFSLEPTPFGELERLLLPAAAHEAQSFPVIFRCLAATSAEPTAAAPSTPSLPPIAWDDPSTTWRPGRLLRLPRMTDTAPATMVLGGGLDDSVGDGDAMKWTLQRPWAFLLAQMAFTKEAWDAERVSGGIAFELEPAHVNVFQTPPCVDVVVTFPTGDEIRCGSLGDFTQRTLAQLGVTVLGHRVTPALLDDRLSQVIDALIRRDVWRFEHGSGGRRAGYAIHPSFSDACYRALGSRAFYRLGSSVTAAIRRVAETWARDRVARAGVAAAAGDPA